MDYATIIGYIDSFDAVHYKIVPINSPIEDLFHDKYWPNCLLSSRFRFDVAEWTFDFCTRQNLNKDQLTIIESKMRHIANIPEWMAQNEAWEAAGRPRGNAYDRFLKRFERSRKKSK